MRVVLGVLLAFFALTVNAASIWGSWYGIDQGQAKGEVVFTFFPDGTYFMNDHGIHALDPTGQPGIERGTYTWDEATGAFSAVTLVNTDGEWGLSDGFPSKVTITGGTLTASDSTVLTRLADPGSALVGGWYLADQPDAGDLALLSFLPNGHYLLGSDPPATGDLEYGTYTWNQSTAAFGFTVVDTTDSTKGFSGTPVSAIVVSDSQIQLTTADGPVIFAATPTPEPQTYALILAGLAGVAAVARRSTRLSKSAAQS